MNLPRFPCFSLQNPWEELCLMTLKSEAKFEEKLTLGFTNDMRNLMNFNAISGKAEYLRNDVLLLSKVCHV